MKHELKIWPQYYARVADGSKTFEVRNNDRAFQMGDTVVLREYDPTPVNKTEKKGDSRTAEKGYTGSPDLSFTIGYVHVLNSSEVIFALIPIKTKPRPVKS